MLGDTIYADIASPGLPGVPQATSLAEFRAKHRENLLATPPFAHPLATLRASTPIFATIDDHEVTNDFAGGAHPSTDPRFTGSGTFINETPLFQTGMRAFLETNPIQGERYGLTGDPRTERKTKLYRHRVFGRDAALFVLDARSFRDEALPPVANPLDPAQVAAFLGASFDPTRTLLGRAQVDELKTDLLAAQQAGVVWKFVMVPEPIQNLGVAAAQDRFEGYAAERTEILAHIVDQGIENVVFVTADIHGTLVNNLSYQLGPGQPQISTSMFEISTGPIAFDQPFGPTVVELALALGVITPAQKAAYDALPMLAKDAFVQQLVDGQVIPLGYDPLGLTGSSVPATLMQGNYLATHVYGWSEFEIDAVTSELLVTTWGVDPSMPTMNPTVVSQFSVQAQ